jgi:hypothetical protein
MIKHHQINGQLFCEASNTTPIATTSHNRRMTHYAMKLNANI